MARMVAVRDMVRLLFVVQLQAARKLMEKRKMVELALLKLMSPSGMLWRR